MDSIFSYIKKHNLYKYVKENNGLIIFLITVSGTAFTFIIRGIGYVYYYAKYKTLNVPIELISERISSVSLTITIVSIFLGIVSTSISTLLDMMLMEIKNNKDKRLIKKILLGLLTIVFYSILLLPTNYTFLLLQRLDFADKKSYMACIMLSVYEVVLIHMLGTQTDKFENNKTDQKKNSKKATLAIVLCLLLTIGLISSVFNAGIKSASSTNSPKQIIRIEPKEYVVVETLDDEYVLAECEENDNALTIHTDKQKVINYENVEYENKKYNSIKLEGNK